LNLLGKHTAGGVFSTFLGSDALCRYVFASGPGIYETRVRESNGFVIAYETASTLGYNVDWVLPQGSVHRANRDHDQLRGSQKADMPSLALTFGCIGSVPGPVGSSAGGQLFVLFFIGEFVPTAADALRARCAVRGQERPRVKRSVVRIRSPSMARFCGWTSTRGQRLRATPH